LLWQELDLGTGETAWERDVPVGRVEGQAAARLSGRRLALDWSDGEGLSLGLSFTPTADGSFVLPCVPAGRSRVHERVDGEQALLLELDVAEGRTARVTLP
jgi:hypothetical protein